MAITFIDIERQKNWRISALFCVLMAAYFIFAIIVVQALAFLIPGVFLPGGSFLVISNLKWMATIALFALFIAAVHFGISGYTAVQRVVEQVGAVKPDPEDGIHRQLVNIMDEIQIASGGRKKISPMVIPTLSMNAMAVTDLRGEAVIAITEGLLSRLTRPQLEAVIAHEAHHVLSGDCLEASLATSLFGMYAGAVEALKSVSAEEPRAVPLLVLFWLLNGTSSLVSMFVSREREYRADAGAVRMTRNPLALAEALDLISTRWAGTGLISEGLEMLCIRSPQASGYDESEGWWADLMSTHPPIRKRIHVLLMMAHVGTSALNKREQVRSMAPEVPPGPLYYALDPENFWQGPFRIAELATFPWFSPQTWIRTDPGGKAVRVSALRSLNGAFKDRVSEQCAGQAGMRCPVCRQPLTRESCERTTVDQCVFCGGVLVDNDKIPRIIARSDAECTERILSLVRAVTADNQRSLAIRGKRNAEKKREPPKACPKCGRAMFRTFYSYAFLIEIDRCGICGVTWFDADELDMLKCIIELKITPRVEAGKESL